MLGVEHHDPELLNRTRPVLRQQVRRELTRRIQPRAVGMHTHQRPSAQFDRRQHLGRTGAADTRNALKIRCGGTRQPVQASALFEHGVGQLQHIASARAAAEHERDELVVAERRRTEPFEFFTRPIVRRDLFHRLYSTPDACS